MGLETARLKFSYGHAALVVVALFTLCVSNNVGPCFLPLPAVADRNTEPRYDSQHNRTDRAPSPSESDNFRVPMMVQKRADKEHHPQPLATTPNTVFVAPDDDRTATEFSYAVSLVTSALVLQPPGRAPPCSV
jgi:hypothetical protein